jgi:hypothetical protein
MYNFLEKHTPNGLGGVVGFILSPILFTLELIAYLKLWKLIRIELITNDKIFEFFDKNNFAYKGFIIYRFVKKDVINPEHPLYSFSNDVNVTLEKLKEAIKKDYSVSLTHLIEQHSSFDVSDYLNITVKTFLKMYTLNGNTFFFKIYTVYIQYWRYVIIRRYFCYFAIFLSTAIVACLCSLVL